MVDDTGALDTPAVPPADETLTRRAIELSEGAPARAPLLVVYGRTSLTTPKTTQVAAGRAAAVLAHAAGDDRVLRAALDVER